MRYFASECDIWIANELKIPENLRKVRLFFEGTAAGTSQSYTIVGGSQSSRTGGFSPPRPLLRLYFHGAQWLSSLYLCFHGARLSGHPTPLLTAHSHDLQFHWWDLTLGLCATFKHSKTKIIWLSCLHSEAAHCLPCIQELLGLEPVPANSTGRGQVL